MSVYKAEQKVFAELAQRAAAQPSAEATVPSLQELRAMKELFAEFSGPPADVPVKECTVPARDGYQIPIRIYNPEATGPVLVFLGGCGYVLDLFEANAIAASRIAQYSNAQVIIVDYRLCPEVTVDTSINDAFDATKYIAMHAKQFGVDPDKIIVGGFSSGAHAAATIAYRARYDDDFSIAHAFMLNGVYDFSNTQNTFVEYEKEDQLCDREGAVKGLFCHYGISAEVYSQAPFSLLFEDDVSKLPAMTILVSEHDGMRSDSEAYFQHLSTTHDNVERILIPGQTHNTIIMRGAMKDGEDPAKLMADIIKRYQ